MRMQDLHNPARLQNELYMNYRMRREHSKMAIKDMMKGRVIWDSSTKGTYRRKSNKT